MSSSRDVEKGEPDEENWVLLGARNEGRQDDGEHLNRADVMELVEFEKPGPSARNIANSNVKTEEQNQFQEPDLSERTIQSETDESEESTDELQEPEPDQNFSLIKAIYNYGNEELISWLKNWINPYACPIPTLRAACQAQSDEDALQILLDARRELCKLREKFDCIGITPLHAAAFSNEPKIITQILGFPEGLYSVFFLSNKRKAATGTHTIPVIKDERSFNFHAVPLGFTALHVASAYAHSQAVRALLMAGANPNLRDERNYTPLDVAGERCTPSDDVQSYEETLQLLKKDGSLSKDTSKVLETALNMRSLQALRLLLDAGAPINQRKPSGYTPMHLCVRLRLKEHLEVLAHHYCDYCPEMNYRAVDVTDEKGSTALHWAAREGWSDGVTVALLAGANITVENSKGDTALHLAAKAGDFDIVKQILDYDKNKQCDFIKKNVKGESPFSYAILSGNADIVKHMCYLNDDMRIYLVTTKIGKLNPLEYAAEKNFQKLFIFILGKISTYKKATPRLLKILAKDNLLNLFAELQKDVSLRNVIKTIIAEEYIIHEAIKHNSREMIIALLREGADLSQRNNYGQTAISLLMYHVTKPTEFMTEILDGCITTEKNICDKNCVIKINYSVLKPKNKSKNKSSSGYNSPLLDVVNRGRRRTQTIVKTKYVDYNIIEFDDDNNDDDNNDYDNNDYDVDDYDDDEDHDHLKTKASDMRVLEALIETGDVYDQRSLLTHPVVESFLYLKWKICEKFNNILISAYVLFLLSLNVFISTFYYHLDHKIEEQVTRWYFNPTHWRLIAICTFLVFSLVDIFFWASSITKWPCNKIIWLKLLSSPTKLLCNKTIWLKLLSSSTKLLCNKTTWLKLLSYISLKLLLFAGGLKMICTPMAAADNDIVRGVAVITVSLSWIYLMILISSTPTFGYYMQMYGKVSWKLIKVMLSLLFPVVGFSICFMILLHSKEPFDDPIAAFLKTMVMMSSEFEYENLMKNKTTDCPTDTKNPTLNSLEDKLLTSVFMLRIFFTIFLICVAIVLMNLILGVAVSDIQELAHDGKQQRLMKQIECIIAFSSFKFTKKETWEVPSKLHVRSDSKIFDKKIKKNIFNKAQSLKEIKEKMADDVGMKAKTDDKYDLTEENMVTMEAKIDDIYDLITKKMAAVEAKINDMHDLTMRQSDFKKKLSKNKKSVNLNTLKKKIARRADLNLKQTKQ